MLKNTAKVSEISCSLQLTHVIAVCPANWQPEKPTINPKKANEYFEKVN